MMVKTQTALMFSTSQVSSKSLVKLAETAVEQAKKSGFGKLSSSKMMPSLEQAPILLCWPRCGGTGT